ncbi:hypothetical protein Tco_0725707 [Tanacetum coccineum]|uniref:Uncharacterized protein n=1 Tax=Tanacetum coccineum TaxID=301880 RepID=A0ABQ4YFU3_9ASTR
MDEEHSKAEEEDVTESPKAAKATKSKTAKQTKPSAPKASKATKPPKPTPTTTEPSKKDQSKKRKLVKETSDAPSPVKRSKAGKEPVYGDEEAGIQRAMELSIKEQAKHTQGLAHPVVIREPDSGRIQPLPDVQGKGKEKRCTPTTTEPSRHAESPSLYAELGLTDNEGQAGPNPSIQDEGQAGLNPGDIAESQPYSSHVLHAGPILEHMDFEVTNASTQQNPKQMDEEFTTTAYPNEPDKSNTEAEVQSMVTVPIHQDTFSVPLMTTLVIDLTMSQPVSTTVQASLPTSTTTVTTITTTTSLPLPPPQLQQSTADPILVRRIGELEQHMADLLQDNLALGERDLPTVDMKEILQHRMFKDDSYKTNNVHKDLYEALQKSLEYPPGSPPSQPPPPPPLAGASSAPGTSRASGSSQLPLPPPPPPTGASGSAPQQGSKAPSSSMAMASILESMAWTTSDTRYESTGVFVDQDSSPTKSLMHDDSTPDE